MTSICFVNPPDLFLEKRGDRCPLGIMYLSSYIKQFGVDTMIWDLNHDDNEDIYNYIEVHKPDYVCISVAVTSYKWSLEFIKKVKSKQFKGKFIGGGNHITNIALDKEPQEYFDYLVIGDGELGLRNIIDNNPKEKVIISKDIDDLDSIPFPDYEGVKMSNYNIFQDNKRTISIVSSRGCKYNCCFCGSAKIKKLRNHSPEYFVRHLEFLKNKYNIESFYIMDDIFSYDKKRTHKICELIISKKLNISFRCTTRSDLLDEELIKHLSEAGCKIISIGCESGSQKVLNAIHKGLTPEKNLNCTKLCKKYGIDTKGFFIFGLPKSDHDTEKQTIEFAKECYKAGMKYIDFYPLVPYPSTPLWDNPEKYELKVIKPIKNEDWNMYFQVGKDGMPDEWKIEHPIFKKEDILNYLKIANEEISKLKNGI